MRLYELFIGFRYLKSKKSQGFISFNTLLSILIVFLGVFILIVVISVLNGFQSQIKDKILDVDSHITVTRSYSDGTDRGIRNYVPLMDELKNIKGLNAVYPYVQGQALLRFKNSIDPVMIRGMGGKETMPDDIKKFIVRGERKFSKGRGVFVGYEMSFNNNIREGDWLELIVPRGQLSATMGVSPGMGRYRVLGFFKTGYYDFDTKLIIMSLPQAQRLFEVGDVTSGIGIKVKDVYRLREISSEIQGTLGFDYTTMTAEERNQNLFYALKLEKLIMTIILFLVIISAGFTIMGTLVMVVMEKRKAVGILKSMGARPNSIMVIFVLEGFLIGVTGSVLGVVFGLATSLNLEAIILWIEGIVNAVMARAYNIFDLGVFYKISLVPSHVYYIDTIPTEIKPEFIVFIAIFAVFLSTVAAIFPAWSASRMRPVDTIRYE